MQERSCPGPVLFEKSIFSEHLRKISYFRVFFWERSSFIFRLEVRSYFREKEILNFPIIQERSNYSVIFWKVHLFRTSGERKYDFTCCSSARVSRLSVSCDYGCTFRILVYIWVSSRQLFFQDLMLYFSNFHWKCFVFLVFVDLSLSLSWKSVW